MLLATIFFLASLCCFDGAFAADEKDAIAPLYQQMMQLYAEGQYDAALPLARTVSERSERAFGSDSLEFAASLNNIAELETRLRQFDSAEMHYKQSLALREQRLPPDHPDIAKSKARLAQLAALRQNSSVKPAQSPTKKTLSTETNAADQAMLDHNRQIDAANKLSEQASRYAKQGDFAKAAEATRAVIAILRKSLPANDPDLGVLTGNLAQFQMQLKNYTEADELFRQAIKILESGRRADDPSIGIMLCNLADISQQQGHNKEAGDYYKRCLSALEKTQGPDSPQVKRVIANMAELYRGENMNPADLPFIQDRLSRDSKTPTSNRSPVNPRKAPDPADLEQAASLDKQVFQMVGQGKFIDALPVALELQDLLERIYGPDDIAIVLNLDSLVKIYRGMGRNKESESLANRAQLIRDLTRAAARTDKVN